MVALLIVWLGERMMGLFARYERPMVVVSVLVLIGLVVYLHFR